MFACECVFWRKLEEVNGCHVCRAGSEGQSSLLTGEWIWAAWGDRLSSCRPTGHIRSPSRQSPLSASFIWEYDLYFLKWRVLNPTIKELRGLPWVRHSNESMAGIWGLFNREKLVFTMPQTGIWRNLSGGEERASLEKKALRSRGLFIAVVFLPLIKERWSALWNNPGEREKEECVWNKIKNAP